MSFIIPYGHQDITEVDIAEVEKILRSDWLTQGPMVPCFEQAIANYCHAQYGVAVCNATSGLHLACRALGVRAGDIVWTSTNTFVASANCALYCGAQVDFVDIDPDTYNMSASELAKKLEGAKKENKLPKVVIPVHFSGQACDMRAIRSLADHYRFYIIEDASHAIGGRYYDQMIGNCAYSDMTVFSFHPVKIITTGEGGMVMTNQQALYDRLKLLVTHGITKKQELMDWPSHGHWYYQMVDLGYNYHLTDLQCALGLSQLQRIDQFVKKRRELAERYNVSLKDLPVRLPYQSSYNYSTFHLYVIQLDLTKIKKTRAQIFSELRQAGIGVNVHYIPVHLQPYYRKLGFKEKDFPNAEWYYKSAITLPLFTRLTDDQHDFVVSKLKEFLLCR